MSKANPIAADFPEEEYTNHRWKRAKELMEKGNLDALMISDNLNFAWFTGHNPGSHKMRPNILILPRVGEPAVFVYLRNVGEVRKTSWITNIEGYIDCPFIVDEFAQFLKKMGLGDARIGCELGRDHRLGMPVLDFVKLKEELLPKSNFTDAGSLLWDLMMTKTPAEMERIRKSCKISDEAYLEWRQQLHADMTQKEVKFLLEKIILEKGATRAGHISLDNTGIGFTMDKPFRKGDLLWVDFGASYRGYGTDYARRLSFGEPTELQKKHHELIWKATLKEIEAIKPGVKCSEVFRVMNDEMKRLDLPPMDARKRAGHGFGLESIPPSLNAFDDTILKPGMILTPEPRFEAEYGRVHVEEEVVVTGDGCEILTRAPRELYVIR